MNLTRVSPSGVQLAYNLLVDAAVRISENDTISLHDLAVALEMLAMRSRQTAEDTETENPKGKGG